MPILYNPFSFPGTIWFGDAGCDDCSAEWPSWHQATIEWCQGRWILLLPLFQQACYVVRGDFAVQINIFLTMMLFVVMIARFQVIVSNAVAVVVVGLGSWFGVRKRVHAIAFEVVEESSHISKNGTERLEHVVHLLGEMVVQVLRVDIDMVAGVQLVAIVVIIVTPNWITEVILRRLLGDPDPEE